MQPDQKNILDRLRKLESKIIKKNELIICLVEEIQQLKQELKNCTCKYSEIEDDLD